MAILGKLASKLRKLSGSGSLSRELSSGSDRSMASGDLEASKNRGISEADTGILNQLTPEGFFVIYVGKDKERFEVEARHLHHPLFKVLLEQGFRHGGAIAVSYEVLLFRQLLTLVENESRTNW